MITKVLQRNTGSPAAPAQVVEKISLEVEHWDSALRQECVAEQGARFHSREDPLHARRAVAIEQKPKGAVRCAVNDFTFTLVDRVGVGHGIFSGMVSQKAGQLGGGRAAVTLIGGDRSHAFAKPERDLLVGPGPFRGSQLVHQAVREFVRSELGQLRHATAENSPRAWRLQKDGAVTRPRAQPRIAGATDGRLQTFVIGIDQHRDRIGEMSPARDLGCGSGKCRA